MTTLLLAIGIPVTYLVIGAFYGRASSVKAYQKVSKANSGYSKESREICIEEEYPYYVLRRIGLWPAYLLFIDRDWSPVGNWFTAPLSNLLDEIDTLEEDAQRWNDLTRTGKTDQEKEMASELHRMLKETIAEKKRQLR